MIFPFREQAEAGGLTSYGPDLEARDQHVGHNAETQSQWREASTCRMLRSTNI